MTDKLRQAAEMALKALEKATEAFLDTEGSHGQIESEAWHAAYDAQEPLRQALAEPEQTPVAYMGTDAEGNPNKFRLGYFGSSIALYTKEQL